MKRYKEYQTISLPWLNNIPANWTMHRNKVFLHESKDVVGNKSKDYTLLSLTLNGIIPRDVSSGKGKFPSDFGTYKIIRPNDIVFCLFDVDETPRTVGLSNLNGMLTGAYDVFHVSGINSRYLLYYYLCLDDVKALRPLYKGLRKTINIDTFLGTRMPVPPSAEQDQIVRYLDWQVSKINRLIAARRKQIEMLREERRVNIDYVFANMQTGVSLKRSAYPWIGSIPTDWSIRAFGKIAVVKSNLVSPSDHFDLFQISPASIEKHTGRIIAHQTVEESGVESANHMFFRGQILFSKIRPRLNKVTIAPYDGLCSAEVYPIETVLYTPYLKYYMLSAYFNRQYDIHMSDRARMPKLNKEELATFEVVIPPNDIQKSIVRTIEASNEKIDKLICVMEKQIDSIRSLSTRLISDVVTGQIDVRDIEIPDFEFTPDVDSAEADTEDETEAEDEEV